MGRGPPGLLFYHFSPLPPTCPSLAWPMHFFRLLPAPCFPPNGITASPSCPFSSAHQSAALLMMTEAPLLPLPFPPALPLAFLEPRISPGVLLVTAQTYLRPCVHSRGFLPPGLPVGREQLSRRQRSEGAMRVQQFHENHCANSMCSEDSPTSSWGASSPAWPSTPSTGRGDPCITPIPSLRLPPLPPLPHPMPHPFLHLNADFSLKLWIQISIC